MTKSATNPLRACRAKLSLLLAASLLSACSSSEPADNSVARAASDEPAAVPEARRTAPVVPPPPAPGSEAANTDPATPGAAPEATTGPALAVEGEGLRLFDRATGRARPIPFGTPRADVEAALAFRGTPGTGTQAECGAGPLAFAAWPDGLKLYYQQGKLAGWALDQRAAGPSGPVIGTAAGAGPGATRAQLADASVVTFVRTTLGQEFRIGPISGVLDGTGPTARVSDMWAGTDCVFR